jgi:tRNA A37 threonylcarbamoyladenosine modification protein TsaB
MAWLFIDTHASEGFSVGTFDPADDALLVRTYEGKSHALLPRVMETVSGTVPDGICVVAGPGSFSAVRIGVLEANILARWWKKPLVGITVAERSAWLETVARLRTGSITPMEYVAPIYDAEPNITLARPAL